MRSPVRHDCNCRDAAHRKEEHRGKSKLHWTTIVVLAGVPTWRAGGLAGAGKAADAAAADGAGDSLCHPVDSRGAAARLKAEGSSVQQRCTTIGGALQIHSDMVLAALVPCKMPQN